MVTANLDRRTVATAASGIITLTALGVLGGLIAPSLAGQTPPHAALTGRVSDALTILENNLRVLAAPFLLWLLRPDTSRLGRAIGDILIAALVAANALPVGVELGRWRGRLIPYVPQLPLEWTALIVSTALWITIRHAHPAARQLALPALAILLLLTAAAAVETWATPHRHPNTHASRAADDAPHDLTLGGRRVAYAPEYAPATATRFKVARSLPLTPLGSARPKPGADRAPSTTPGPPQGGTTT